MLQLHQERPVGRPKLPFPFTFERRPVAVRRPAPRFRHIYLREELESRRFDKVRIFLLKVPDNDPRTFEGVKCFEEQEFKRRRFDPIDVARETRYHRHSCLLDKIAHRSRFSQRAAGTEVNYPIREPVIHHSSQLRKLHTVAMQVNSPGRAVKCEVKYAVISFAEQVEVVLQFLSGIAREMAELRLHGLRDQL